LGAGFLEKLYERALVNELALRGITAVTQVSYPVAYKGQLIGEFHPDLVVENILIVELKCVDRFAPTHLAQCLSYLQASGPHFSVAAQFPAPKSGVSPGRPVTKQIKNICPQMNTDAQR
jgi:GxxExxY protein